MKPVDIMAWCEARGIRLYTDGDRLRYQTQGRAISPELVQRLKLYKAEILDLLQNQMTNDTQEVSIPLVQCGTCQHYQGPAVPAVINDPNRPRAQRLGICTVAAITYPVFVLVARRCERFQAKEDSHHG